MAGEQLELLESSIAETSGKKEKPANPMFKATMNDARLFRNLIGAISSLIEEADFNASPDGIKLRSMDPSHIAMVDFEWPKTAFDTYECTAPTKLRLSVSSTTSPSATTNSSSVPKPTIHPGQLWSPAMIVLVSAGFSSSFMADLKPRLGRQVAESVDETILLPR